MSTAERLDPRPREEWLGSWRPEQPRRLSDETHELAQRFLSGEFGRAMQSADFALDEAAMEGVGPNTRYGHAAKLVAEKAPLRILPGERIVGAATLLEAPQHRTPVEGGVSVSHTTIGFHHVLPQGYAALREQVEDRLARGDLDEKGVDLLSGMRLCLDTAAVWHQRHMDALAELIATARGEERATYSSARAALERVPEHPPETFHEAVQSLWFMWEFQRLMGNWSGIGRIDEMLGPYLERDLAEGRITLDEARELIAHFWLKGCEWVGAIDIPSGDAQHYQNIVLGGVNSAGEEITNEVTYLVLDVIEELHISDFPVAVRVSSRTPERLLRRIAEVQRQGGGVVSIYGEDVVIEGLVKFGYPLEEARTFANDGCWEVLIPGRTLFGYMPFDALALLHEVLGLHEEGEPPSYPDFDSLYAAYLARLRQHVDWHNEMADDWNSNGAPHPLLSLFMEDCIERGRGYYDRGTRYSVIAPHAGGLANVGGSLLVLRRLVYEQAALTLPEFIAILRDDWEGHEELRRQVLSRFRFYGNDNAEADAMVERVFNDYTGMVAEVKERYGVRRPCGLSTFGREIEWSAPTSGRRASPDGQKRGAVLATNFSPSPGTDRDGPTAAIKSYCRMDFTRTPNGATLELKMLPGSLKGQAGVEALVTLMKTFVDLGGFYLSIDVIDSEMLRDAQRHPENYPNLSVRISGWSARFATLCKEWQDMIINRTQQVL